MSAFFAANLDFVYLLYGLSFLAFGLVMQLESRTAIRPPGLDSAWLLAGFGLTHGMAEWASLAVLLRSGAGQEATSTVFATVGLALAAVSFVLLFQFGLTEISLGTALLRWPQLVPVTLLAIAVIALFTVPALGPVGERTWLVSGEALVRYLLALPGALLTALAFGRAARTRHPPPAQPSPYLWGAAAGFAVYALLTGLIVPPAPFPPANALNSEWFFATFGLPVAVGRTICALAVTGLLAEAFVVEATRADIQRREELDRLKDEFISIASHELRAPLAPLRGYAEFLLPRARAGAAHADEIKP